MTTQPWQRIAGCLTFALVVAFVTTPGFPQYFPAPPPPGPAAVVTAVQEHTCTVDSVANIVDGSNSRIETQCRNPWNGYIRWFTLPTGGAMDGRAMLTLQIATTHLASQYVWFSKEFDRPFAPAWIFAQALSPTTELVISFDLDDLSGAAYGCLNSDCRNIITVRMNVEKLDFSFKDD